MQRWLIGIVAAALVGCGGDDPTPTPEPEPAPVFDYPLDDTLRFHELQTKSTHNSYHIEPEGNSLDDWRYTMAPLDEQMDSQGVRHVELDVRRNPDGVFEVFHLPIIDEVTTCFLFTDCLAALKTWSDAHRAHHAIVVQLEIKDGTPPAEEVEPYFAALEAEITSVWPQSRILTPGDVQGDAATLGEVIASEGWPTLGETRGKLILTLDNGGELRDLYTHGGADLDGRLIFANGDPSAPYASIAVINSPTDSSAISAALAANMLVRTRADSGSVEPLANDTSRLETALASGAHFITTDYPVEVDYTPYFVTIPDGTPSRCNPVTASATCTSRDLEDPDQVSP